MGCQVIAEKQAELEKQGVDLGGMKVALLPVAVHAALEAEREMKRRQRGRCSWDDEDDE